MAKSIRSKCKRKSRSEFRKTIGTVAYNKTAATIQEKLQENLGKQSMESLDRISSIFEKSQSENDAMVLSETAEIAVDANETKNPTIAPKDFKGENKAPAKKSKRKKHAIGKQQRGTPKAVGEKKRPKFFCQF